MEPIARAGRAWSPRLCAIIRAGASSLRSAEVVYARPVKSIQVPLSEARTQFACLAGSIEFGTRYCDRCDGPIALTVEVSSDDGSSRHYKCRREGPATGRPLARAHDRYLFFVRPRSRRFAEAPRPHNLARREGNRRRRTARIPGMRRLYGRSPGICLSRSGPDV